MKTYKKTYIKHIKVETDDKKQIKQVIKYKNIRITAQNIRKNI